jgi:hypothetical protein
MIGPGIVFTGLPNHINSDCWMGGLLKNIHVHSKPCQMACGATNFELKLAKAMMMELGC